MTHLAHIIESLERSGMPKQLAFELGHALNECLGKTASAMDVEALIASGIDLWQMEGAGVVGALEVNTVHFRQAELKG